MSFMTMINSLPAFPVKYITMIDGHLASLQMSGTLAFFFLTAASYSFKQSSLAAITPHSLLLNL